MKKMFNKLKSSKRGVASFYIVAFSTLILVVVATSFAMVILSDMTRTLNNDLSQSAYDSVMSGVEDAKMAYTSYTRCKEQGVQPVKPSGTGTDVTCSDIMWWVEQDTNAASKCYMVGHILGKIPKNENTEVKLGETVGKSGVTMNQAYTCAQINRELFDYRATLNSNNSIQIIRASMAGEGETQNIGRIRLKWFAVGDDIKLNFNNFKNGKVVFPRVEWEVAATPPTVELRMVQTGESFNVDQFDRTSGDKTNRATLYLVPASYYESLSMNNSSTNYIYNGNNIITKSQVVKTNDRMATNKPFIITCENEATTKEFYCSATIELPDVIGNNEVRNDETFAIAVSLPYQKPDTDFSVEFLCADTACATASVTSSDSTMEATLNMQIEIDVTGRANDMYRRVVTRVNTKDETFNATYPFYTLQILGDEGASKNVTTTKEWNHYF